MDEHIKIALSEKSEIVSMFFITCKDEAIFELYAKSKDEHSCKLLKRYDILQSSSILEPK
ncbi:MAG: hypothetical protein LBD84_02465 [Campylobacteraceae bacterium]|nr:hypothetical protein [Campylobacteraceae bacterium]